MKTLNAADVLKVFSVIQYCMISTDGSLYYKVLHICADIDHSLYQVYTTNGKFIYNMSDLAIITEEENDTNVIYSFFNNNSQLILKLYIKEIDVLLD